MRDAAFAGYFYPRSREEIAEFIAKNNLEGAKFSYKKLIGLIVPHAGYQFSGRTAISAYRIIDKEYTNIIIIGPCHDCLSGKAYIDDSDWYTPFGIIKVNKEITEKLIESGNVSLSKEANAKEHSIEVQLPLLKYFIKNDFTIVPIILADQSEEFAVKLAKAIENVITDDTLIIISSDLNHYEDRETTTKKDMSLIAEVEKLDIDGMYSAIKNKRISACGYGGIAIIMQIIKDMRGKIKLIEHSDSSLENNDKDFTVGYSSMSAYL